MPKFLINTGHSVQHLQEAKLLDIFEHLLDEQTLGDIEREVTKAVFTEECSGEPYFCETPDQLSAHAGYAAIIDKVIERLGTFKSTLHDLRTHKCENDGNDYCGRCGRDLRA